MIKYFFIFMIVITTLTGFFCCKNEDSENKNIAELVGDYYVAVNGNDTNPGTPERPFATWQKAVDTAIAGDLILIREGIYYPDSNKTKGYHGLDISKSGSTETPFRLWGYPGESVILDCSRLSRSATNIGINLEGNNWHLKNLEVTNVTQYHTNFAIGILLRDADNNMLENVRVHDCGGSGIRVILDSDNNKFIHCDSYYNYDRLSTTPGGNADGFTISYIPKGYRNYYTGCRSWSNSDDGFDLWENEGIVIFDSCWSFWNGYKPGTHEIAGDGNGFKLGKTVENMDASPQRIVTRCLAFENRQRGFDQNGADVIIAFYNNTSYHNGKNGFYCNMFHTINILKNNLSYKNIEMDAAINDESVNDHNSWNGLAVSDNDFRSLSTEGIDGKRNSFGDLPVADFLRLSELSILINAGIDVELSYNGSAPDIGCFELDGNK